MTNILEFILVAVKLIFWVFLNVLKTFPNAVGPANSNGADAERTLVLEQTQRLASNLQNHVTAVVSVVFLLCLRKQFGTRMTDTSKWRPSWASSGLTVDPA